MLLEEYRLQVFRSKCHPSEDVLHGHAHLGADISKALPYLNAELGGDTYCVDPPSLTFRWHGKLVTLHSRLIALNALRDEKEAHDIIRVLMQEINSVWDRRDAVTPSYETPKPPQVMEILRHLPKTNCGDCGRPTCMVFAIHVAQGIQDMSECNDLSGENRRLIEDYMRPWNAPSSRG